MKMGADGLPCTLMLDVSFLQCNVLSRSCLEPFFFVVAGADKKGMLRLLFSYNYYFKHYFDKKILW